MPSHSGLGLAVCLSLGLVCLPCLAQEGAVGRIGIRDGHFVDTATGAPYVPLGVNYYRVGEVKPGKVEHATFCPGFYDPGFIEKMMTNVAAMGFNTVRTFQVYDVGKNGILTSPDAREISPAYLDNVLDFLRRARAHGIHVIFTWDIWIPQSKWWSTEPLPGEAGCDLRPDWDPAEGINNFRINLGSVRTRANAIVALIDAIRARDPGLLPVVMSWELENEVYVSAKAGPFADRTSKFKFAGRTYNMASDEEEQALQDAMLVQWANLCTGAVHRADPKTLVSAGLFTFAAVGRGGPGTLSEDHTGDARIPGRPLALLGSKLDFVDIHLYAGRSAEMSVAQHLRRDLKSEEWDAVKERARELGKPVICGETGVFAHYLRSAPDWQKIDFGLGGTCLREQVEGIKAAGLDGALYWPYGNPDSKPDDQTPALTLHPEYAKILREAWLSEAGTNGGK